MDATFIQARIDATKAQIIAFEDAILALGTAGGVQSYTIDTGQTRQTVTRQDLSSLQNKLDGLYNRLVTLEARLNGSGTSIGWPGW